MSNIILSSRPLGFQWTTFDPFLFCVHHDDAYPKGNESMGPEASLSGRNIGSDFVAKDGWRMYHGDTVPGFPRHPHRGFETITLVRRGYIDHSDSLGATARFGHGDVQWMTAGSGIVHSEMFPLVKREEANPAELFQIWLNLPASDKMVDPYFTMLWNESIPRRTFKDEDGLGTEVVVVAGQLGDMVGPPPPPNSWASRPDSGLALWTIAMEPMARWTLPAAAAGVNRGLFFFAGGTMTVAGQQLPHRMGLRLKPDADVELVNGPEPAELLLLQGRPIGEPVAHHGPFVMNTRAELQQAFTDYQKTGFGGWPWPRKDPVHKREDERFAIHADGKVERPA